MTHRNITNLGASIRQRLQNHARLSNRPFDEILRFFAMERFLYRLSKSAHADRFTQGCPYAEDLGYTIAKANHGYRPARTNG